MSDKPLAGLVAAVAVAPLCVLCVLGPAAFLAAGGWFLTAFGGFGLPLTAAALAGGGWLAWRALKRRSVASEEPKRELAERQSRGPLV